MRTPAYQGVMAARVHAAMEEDRKAKEKAPPDPGAVPADIESTLQMEVG
jgi:hypothetical protein